MKQYVCGICGYIHDEAVGGKWEDLPADWKCPVCKAGKDAFKPKEEKTASQEVLEKPHVDKELSPMEMSIICSNLARGCEKQYLPQQADDFRKLAEFFRSKAAPVEEASTAKLLELIDKDLSVGYPYGNAVAGEKPDRGGLRCQVWSEKVITPMKILRSVVQIIATEFKSLYIIFQCCYAVLHPTGIFYLTAIISCLTQDFILEFFGTTAVFRVNLSRMSFKRMLVSGYNTPRQIISFGLVINQKLPCFCF